MQSFSGGTLRSYLHLRIEPQGISSKDEFDHVYIVEQNYM